MGITIFLQVSNLKADQFHIAFISNGNKIVR